jgi:endoglucanase
MPGNRSRSCAVGWPAVLAVLLLAGCASGGGGGGLPDCPGAPQGALDPYAQAQALGRGVNSGNLLEADPDEGAWSNGIVLEESHFALAKAAGFDSVRLPVGFALHSRTSPPYTIDETFLARVDQVVDWGLASGLRMVVDLHNYNAVQTDPQGQRARFVALWRQIATHFRCAPDQVYYELLNEPNTGLDTETWNGLVAETLSAIRAIDPRHTVVVGATDWSNPDGLAGLHVPAAEKNAIVTFHYYTPTLFCFQGKQSWMGKDWSTTGITWPGPPASPATPAAGVSTWVASWIQSYNTTPADQNPAGEWLVESDIAQAAAWGEANQRPLWMSEFTAQDGADLASRARWMATVRTQLEASGIPWSAWTLLSDPGSRLYDTSTGLWTTELTAALGLDVHN